MKKDKRKRWDTAQVKEALDTVEGAGYGFLAGAAASAAITAAFAPPVTVPALVTLASSTTGAGIGYFGRRKDRERKLGKIDLEDTPRSSNTAYGVELDGVERADDWGFEAHAGDSLDDVDDPVGGFDGRFEELEDLD